MWLISEHFAEPCMIKIHNDPWWSMGLMKWLQEKKPMSKTKRKNAWTLLCQCKDSFSKGFSVRSGLSYKRKLKIRRVGKNVKINSKYYQGKVLCSIFRKDIPFLYFNDFYRVKPHQEKATSHTTGKKYYFIPSKNEDSSSAHNK